MLNIGSGLGPTGAKQIRHGRRTRFGSFTSDPHAWQDKSSRSRPRGTATAACCDANGVNWPVMACGPGCPSGCASVPSTDVFSCPGIPFLVDARVPLRPLFNVNFEGKPVNWRHPLLGAKAQILAAGVNAGYHNSKYPQNCAGHVSVFSVWNIYGGVRDRRK